MRSKMYIIGIAAVVFLMAMGFRILPSPFQGGVAGWFSLLWYLAACAAGLGYWYKYDRAHAQEERKRLLSRARGMRNKVNSQGQRARQKAW